MAESKLVQVYCTHCGDTRTFAKGDKRINARSCKVCLQGTIKPVVTNGAPAPAPTPVVADAPPLEESPAS